MAVSPKVFRVVTYNFACLHCSTQSNLWGNIEDGHMGTLKKNWLRTFQNVINEITQTWFPKKIISVRRSIAHYIICSTQ